MKKSIIKLCGTLLVVLMSFAIMSCSPSGAGAVVKKGITINGTTYAKTSEVAIIPAGEHAVIETQDDSSWNSYVAESEKSYWKGAFIKDRYLILSPFAMGQYEVTQELYQAVMGETPINFKDDAAEGEIQKLRPVELVSYGEAAAFCNELTKKTMTDADIVYFNDAEQAYTKADAKNKTTPYVDITKKGYRLPTETEWEYAARGGKFQSEEWKNAFGKVNTKDGKMIHDGDNMLEVDENLATVGWYKGNSNNKTHEVGLKDKNSLNLYDMAGNVWEWCCDWDDYVRPGYASDPCEIGSSSDRVIRGGCYYNAAGECAVSIRLGCSPYWGSEGVGFRVVRSIR